MIKFINLRVVVPKEVTGGKNPEESFIIQESSSTGYRNATDHNATGITTADHGFNRNLRFIGFTCIIRHNCHSYNIFTSRFKC